MDTWWSSGAHNMPTLQPSGGPLGGTLPNTLWLLLSKLAIAI